MTTLLVTAGCGGGGGSSGSAASASPSVAAITSAALKYGSTTTFTVSGVALDQGVVLTASGACSALTESGTPSATARTFTCVPGAVGALTVSAAASGTVLASASFTVPAPQVTFTTSLGTIVVALDPTHAPVTVNNFLQYVNSGFYNGTIFHRVVAGFVIQGGGFDTSGAAKATAAAIKLEAPASTGLSNTVGTIAMARTSVLDSATSQFFINTVDNKPLDTSGGGYAVFGSTVQGLATVKAIEAMPVNASSVPTTPVVVTTAVQSQ